MTLIARILREPLRVDGTELPPNLLLIAKLLVIGLVLKQYPWALPDVFAPTVPFLEGLPAPYFRLALQAAFAVAATALILNQRVRTACLVLGVVFLVATMSSRVYYRNAKVFCGLVFTLIGLQERDKPVTLLPWQLGVMYFGCGLNKLFEADWRSGQYFAHYLSHLHRSDFYAVAAPLLPAGWLALFLCWFVIVAELTAGLLFFAPSLRRMAVWLAAGVHAGAAMMVGTDYGIFLSAILASYFVVMPWPRQLVIRSVLSGPLAWLARLHWLSTRSGDAVRYETAIGRRLVIEADGRVHRGLDAIWRLAAWTPALSIGTMAVLTSVRAPWLTRAVRGAGFTIAVLLVVTMVIWVRKIWAQRRVGRRVDLPLAEI